MQFIPICLECENFKKVNVCTVYGTPPYEKKNREKHCPHFTGGEYGLYRDDRKQKKKNK